MTWLLEARPQWIEEHGLNLKMGRINVQSGITFIERQFDKQFLIKEGFRDITPDILKKVKRENPKSILIIRAGGFGDVLMALPVIEALKRKFPTCEIDVLIDGHHFEVIKGHWAIRNCIDTFPQYIGHYVDMYDEVIDFSTIIPNNPEAEYRNVYDLHFEWAGLPVPQKDSDFICELPYNQKEEEVFLNHLENSCLSLDRKWIIINLMATSSVRQYPFHKARELAINLANKYPNKEILFCGTQPVEHLKYRVPFQCLDCGKEDYIGLLEAPTKVEKVKCTGCEAIILVYPDFWCDEDIFEDDTPEKTWIQWFKFPTNVTFLNTSMKEFIYVVRNSELVISVDSAPLHIAGMVGTPAIGLFSSFDPYTRLSHFKGISVVTSKFRCAPCFQHSQTCPTAMRDRTIFAPCMDAIKVSEIEKEVEIRLKGGKGNLPKPFKQPLDGKDVLCPICGEKDSEHRLRKGNHNYYSCKDCETLFIYPPPSKEEVREIYSDPSYNNIFKIAEYCNTSSRKWAQKITESWKYPPNESYNWGSSPKPLGKVLEIGCNVGWFGHEMTKLGWDYLGIDLNEDGIKYAKGKLSLADKVICGNILDKEVQEKVGSEYDLLVLHQVLEHLDNPDGFLLYLLNFIKVGGMISLTMPDIDQWHGETEWPHLNCHSTGEHVTVFSHKAMNIMASNLNLEILTLESQPHNGDFWILLRKKG